MPLPDGGPVAGPLNDDEFRRRHLVALQGLFEPPRESWRLHSLRGWRYCPDPHALGGVGAEPDPGEE